jgi:hypothetical protein
VVDHRPDGLRRGRRGPGSRRVGFLPLTLGNETVLTVTELTLAVLLFSDASTVRLRDVEGDSTLPAVCCSSGCR